jgi:hypothetical protein
LRDRGRVQARLLRRWVLILLDMNSATLKSSYRPNPHLGCPGEADGLNLCIGK